MSPQNATAETVLTTKSAQIYVYQPRSKVFSPKGTCFKAAGVKVQVQATENPSFVQIVEDGKPTSHYLKAKDVKSMVAQMAAV